MGIDDLNSEGKQGFDYKLEVPARIIPNKSFPTKSYHDQGT